MTDPAPWWRDAVVYQIYIRSFTDTDGDGIGDIGGMRSRLPYLRDLGVDALWVNPWFVSPMVDGGYDVADYRDIDPLFGTLADAEGFIDEAHALGIRVLLDIVPNHTSDRHPWFQAALAAGPGSRERDFYVFRDGRGSGGSRPPTDWPSVFGGPAWTRVTEPDGRPGQWYLHLFAPEQPDSTGPSRRCAPSSSRSCGSGSTAARTASASTWPMALSRTRLSPTSAGGRRSRPCGPAPTGTRTASTTSTGAGAPSPTSTAIACSWPRCSSRAPSAWHATCDPTSSTPRSTSVPAGRLGRDRTTKGDRRQPSTRWRRSARRPRGCCRTMTRHGTSHGSVASAARASTRSAGSAAGRRRSRPTSSSAGAGPEPALLLMLALPGCVYLYQGEELGLEEVEDLPEELLQDPTWLRSGHTIRGRDGCRVPLPWSGTEPPFGFGPPGSEPWLPQPLSWRERSVERQMGDPSSFLELYRTALRMRREHLGFRGSGMAWLPAPESVLRFDRPGGLETVVNLGTTPIELPTGRPILLASEPLAEVAVLPPDTAVWLG